MDNQDNNQNPITPLPPLQPMQPTPAPTARGFSFDVPKPPLGEELIASSRIDVPSATPNAVSSSTLSSFSDFKPTNTFSTINTQSSAAQLSSGGAGNSRFSKRKILGIVVALVLILLLGGAIYAFTSFSKTGKSVFSLFGALPSMKGNLDPNLTPQDQTAPAPAPAAQEQVAEEYITYSPSLDAAPVTNSELQYEEVIEPTPPAKFPKSGIGPEDGPL